MESQPQNPEFRNNPENFHPCNIHLKFPDFSLTFDHYPDPFGRPILAIFIHQQFENFVQIFMLADLIFKEKNLKP